MNIYAYAVIPLVVVILLAFIYTTGLVWRVLSESGVKQMIVYVMLLLVYGLLGFLAVEFDVISNALATFLTLFAALLSRVYSLTEVFRQYEHIKNHPEVTPHAKKRLSGRFIEILPDVILTVLLFVVARDIKEKYHVHDLMMTIIYFFEVLYAMVVFAYVVTGDMIEKLVTERNKGKAQ